MQAPTLINRLATLASGAWLGGLHLGQSLGWIAYAAALPGLFSLAGLPTAWLPIVLLADQLVFASVDFLGGIGVDLIHSRVRRLAWPMAAAGLVSALTLGGILAWPQVVRGSVGRVGLLGLIFMWAILSSILRGPTFSLIVRRERAQAHWLQLGMWTIGMAMTGMLTPFWTSWVRQADPLLPILLSSTFLLGSAISLPMVISAPKGIEPDTKTYKEASLLGTFVGALFLGGCTLSLQLATQINNVVLLPQILNRIADTDQRTLILALGGVGMTLSAPIVLLLNSRIRPGILLVSGLLVGLPALAGISLSASVATLGFALLVWGAAQTLAMCGGATLAAQIGGPRFTGLLFGIWWSAGALATAMRMAWLAWGPSQPQDLTATSFGGVALLLLSLFMGLPLLRYAKVK